MLLLPLFLMGCGEPIKIEKIEPSFDNPQDVAALSPAAQVACVFRWPAIWIGLGIFILCLNTTIGLKRRK